MLLAWCQVGRACPSTCRCVDVSRDRVHSSRLVVCSEELILTMSRDVGARGETICLFRGEVSCLQL